MAEEPQNPTSKNNEDNAIEKAILKESHSEKVTTPERLEEEVNTAEDIDSPLYKTDEAKNSPPQKIENRVQLEADQQTNIKFDSSDFSERSVTAFAKERSTPESFPNTKKSDILSAPTKNDDTSKALAEVEHREKVKLEDNPITTEASELDGKVDEENPAARKGTSAKKLPNEDQSKNSEKSDILSAQTKNAAGQSDAAELTESATIDAKNLQETLKKQMGNPEKEIRVGQDEELVTESIAVIQDAKKNDGEDDEDFAEEDMEALNSDSENVDDALTEDNEDDSNEEKEKILKKDYDKMGKEALIKEFRHLVANHKIQAIKEHVDDLRATFISKFEEEQDEAKEKFLEEGGNVIDFRYYSPLKKDFNTLYFEYRDKRKRYFESLKKDLNSNLDVRNALVEELKGLKDQLGGDESINATYERFRDIQDRWRSAGNIPRDRYNLTWDTYHHHVENFYDFLHLNREFRDKDFKENLDKKMKLVEQAEELIKAKDITRAFKELQLLHKMWKEEIGPVASEFREEIWDKFSAATKKIHESRQDYFKNIDAVHEENLVKKQELIAKIEEIATQNQTSHGAWQKQFKKVNALRDEFFALGKVPRKDNEPTWKAFKKATRDFNRAKNNFYKEQKGEQFDNLAKKKELIQIAEDNKDSEDVEATTNLMKKIQADWKKIGHVPRKDSDKVWKKFKAACNHFFDKLHAEKNGALQEEKDNLEVKQGLLEKIKIVKLSGEKETDLKMIKAHINEWKDTGRVPFSQKNIERDFNKVLDGLFKDLDMGRKETELIKFDNRVAAMADRDDERQIDKERFFISKKIDEVKAEINQLENNLGFFQHVPVDNPMVVNVHKNIAEHKKTLEIWKAKMDKIKKLY